VQVVQSLLAMVASCGELSDREEVPKISIECKGRVRRVAGSSEFVGRVNSLWHTVVLGLIANISYVLS